jgi:hypothetical protein
MTRSGGRSGADLRRLAEVGAAALLGGVLAALLLVLIQGVARPGFIALLVAAMTLFCVMATDALQSAQRRRPARRAPQQVWRPAPPPHPVSRPAAAPIALPQPEHTWHLAAARDSLARAATPSTVPRPPAPPVDPGPDPGPARVEEIRVPGRSGGVRRIVQCPRCAEFDVGAAADGAGFAFGCRGCRHRWQWAPGRPWPPTVARPALAHRTAPRPPA